MKSVPSKRSEKLLKTGSPQTGEPVYLTIGKLRRTHGVQGEIIMDALTDAPEMITAGRVVFVGGHHKEEKIKSVRTADQSYLVAFEGYEDCDQVGIFRNQYVFIRTKDAAPLADGKYYHHEVIGMEVVDESGEFIGKVTEIIDTGANDVYVIQPDNGNEVLIPAIKTVVLEIDAAKKKMKVRLLEWE